MDPAWPITSKAPIVKSSIHINPKFLNASSKKPEESTSVKEVVKQQEVVKQLLAKQERIRRFTEEAKETEKRTSTVTVIPKSPYVVHVHPSEDSPTERSVTPKLDPRVAQRDPRLQKGGGSAVVHKGLPEDKSVKNISPVVKTQQGSVQKHSPLPSVVLVPGTSFSQSQEVDVGAASKNDRKAESSSDPSKRKVDKPSPVEAKNFPVEQSKSEESNSVKRFPSPQKLSSEPHPTETQDKAQRGQESSRKTRLDASPSKNKNFPVKEKQLNVNSKYPASNKSSTTEKPKAEVKDSHVETLKYTGRPLKGSPKASLEVEKESEIYGSRSRSKATTEERRVSPRHRSRSPLHDEDKKKDSKSSKIPSRSARHLPVEKGDVEKVDSNNEPAVVNSVPPNDFPKVDTDLRVSARSVSPEKNTKGNKRDNSTCKENENQESVHDEPPAKKAKDEKENDNSENVSSWFGNQDQDYRCKERGNNVDSHQGWAQYKAVHPDEFKSPLRPARENMENIAPDNEDFREAHDKSLPNHSQRERHPYHGGDPEIEYDRLGRPRLHRRRNDNRFRGRRGRRYDQLPRHQSFDYGYSNEGYDVSMLSDPQFIIRQAEERLRARVITEDCFREIRDGLLKMMDSARKLGLRIPSFKVSPMYPPKYEQVEFPGPRIRHVNKPHGLVPPSQMALRAKGPKPGPPSTCSFELDHVKRDIHFVDDKAIVVIDGVPRQIVLKGQPTQVFIEGLNPITVNFDRKPVRFEVEGKVHTMKFGVPTRELYIDDYPYEGKFGGPPFVVDIDGKSYSVNLGKPIPEVVFSEEPQPELYKKFLAGIVGTEPSNARMSPTAEKDINIEGKCSINKFPIKTENTDFVSAENERTASSTATASESVPFDIDMRTVTLKKEPEECERRENFNGSEYAEVTGNRSVSDMKDVDYRNRSSSMNFAPPMRDNSHYPPPNVDFPVMKDSCRPADAQADSMLHPGLPRNQVGKSDGELNFRNIFTDSNPQMRQDVWSGPLTHNSLEDRTRNNTERQEWENNQERAMAWQECGPRHSQLPVQPHDRPLPHIPSMPNWRGGRFTPPYSQNEAADCMIPPRVITPQQPNWRQPLDGSSEGNPNMPGWEWKPRGFRPDAPVPSIHSHTPEQGHPYSMQRSETKPPFENYRGPYEQLPPPPLPPRAPLRLMGNQLRPEMPVQILRPTMPSSDLQNSRPPPPAAAPHQRPWLPRNPLGTMPPPVRERPLLNFPHPLSAMSGPPVNSQLRTTLPPPPLPPNLPNIPVSLQGPVPFNLSRVPSPVVSEMSSVEQVTSQGHVPPYTGPEVQIKTETTSSCQAASTGPQQLSQATQQAVSQGGSLNVPLQNSGPPVINEVVPSCSTTPPYVDLSTLMERLIAAGIIPSKPPQAEKMEVVEQDVKSENENTVREEPTPPIEITAESLKCRYPGVISALFRGTQCASCGMRFKDTHGEHYSRHLDWHFRVNRREKDGAKKAFSRKWYYDVEDWTQFEEFEDFEERARSFFELQADEELLQTPASIEVPTVPAAHGNETEVCVVCGEAFQLLWVEEEEEWHLKDAVREDERPYHPLCFEDFKKASEVPDTPVDETPPADTSMTDKEQEAADMDTTPAEDAVPKEDVKTEGDDVEDTKEKNDVSAKQEDTEESSAVAAEEEKDEEETVQVKEEPVEDEPLEGKPGEEEIIGLITESDMEEEERKEPPKESKMVVLQSGGIVMKVRAESIQQPASPAPAAPPDKDTDQKKEDGDEEFRPPTPDPRFKVLPPVNKGTELSGLCSIM